MRLKSVYHWFQSALSNEQCDRIIELGMNKMRAVEAVYGEKASDGDMCHKHKSSNSAGKVPLGAMDREEMHKRGLKEEDVYTRDTKVSWLSDSWIYELFHPYILEANEKAGWNFKWDYSQTTQFTKYGVNQFCGWHADANDTPYQLFDPNIHESLVDQKGNFILDEYGNKMPKHTQYITTDPNYVGKIRKLSMTCNLSNEDDYVGGDLRFDLGPHLGDRQYVTCREVRPRGSIIVFPSHIYHQVTPITAGTRLSLVMWSIGYPFR